LREKAAGKHSRGRNDRGRFPWNLQAEKVADKPIKTEERGKKGGHRSERVQANL